MKYLKFLLILFIFSSLPVSAHNEWCDGVTVEDVKTVNGETWVKISNYAHFGSTDLHMKTSPKWVKEKEVPCESF